MNLRHLIPSFLLLVSIGAAPASAQCILANPSFELDGSGGAAVGGWNQFGVVGTVGAAVHGSQAVLVHGPDTGVWDVSGVWQSRDCVPGEQWTITGHVRHAPTAPLTGSCAAIVNVEWRDGAEALIDYDSFNVALPATPTDVYREFALMSSAAPTGTVTARILLGVLQGPSDPSPDVSYDQITFDSTTYPTVEDIQWNDFPGGTTLSFAGRDWRVKGPGVYGPGNNEFCDGANCVWVDSGGRLHVTVKNQGGFWSSTEVVAEEALGYGDYVLTTRGRLDLLDPQVVLGIFLWEYGPCWDDGYLWWNPYNEIDIEYGRWGNASQDIGQFVAQPYDYPGNLHRFDLALSPDERVSHALHWTADSVEYRVWRGGAADESPQTTVHVWTYIGPHIPRPESPRMHLNLWKLDGTPAADQEVVFDDFRFTPENGPTGIDLDDENTPHALAAGHLHPAAPNPFNPRTRLCFELDRGGYVELLIYDLGGRLVRTLVHEALPIGEHRADWDGRDEEGRGVATGAYLVQLRGGNFVESRSITIVK